MLTPHVHPLGWPACLPAFFLCAASACSSPKVHTAPSTTTPEEHGPRTYLAERDAARLVIERHCGDCHVPDSPQALPRALAVYDLRKPDWAATMNEGQLRQLAGRLQRGPLFDPFDSRNAGKAPPPPADPDEIATVSRYVELELTKRAKDQGNQDGSAATSKDAPQGAPTPSPPRTPPLTPIPTPPPPPTSKQAPVCARPCGTGVHAKCCPRGTICCPSGSPMARGEGFCEPAGRPCVRPQMKH